jgi:predicted esterase
MRRVLVAGMLVLGGLAAPALASTPPIGQPTFPSAPLLGPAEVGTLCSTPGYSIWTDYAYDDRASAYPTGVPRNSGDLVQVTLVPGRREELGIVATLETLTNAAMPVVGLAIDSDASPRTGAAALPGSWRPKSPLGVDTLFTIDHRGGQVRRFTSGRWGAPTPTHAGGWIDADTNKVTGWLPTEYLKRARDTVRVFAVVGTADASGNSWATGQGAISDLGYVGGEDFTGSQNARQNAILDGTGDPADAAIRLDRKALRTGRGRECPWAGGPGLHGYLYHSSLKLAEGIAPYRTDVLESQGGDTFLGPFQPYSVYVPKRLPKPAPLLMFLHGFGGSHLEDPRYFGPGNFDPNAVVVMPLARGDGFYYAGIGEQDVYDVEADARRRWRIDNDRVYLSGISMGGMGTFRLAQLRPDHWAGVAPIINMSSMPLPEEQGAAEHRLLPAELENLTNIPVRMVNGRLDPLANVNPDKDVAELTARGIDFRYVDLIKRQHEVVAPMQACVLADAMAHRRVRNPARVVFSRQPSMESAEVTGGLPRRYDSAYWVSRLKMRDPQLTFDDKATVDATSFARHGADTSVEPVASVGQNVSGPGDPCGTPGSKAKTDDAWYVVGQRVTPVRTETRNYLAMQITRVAEVTFDLRRAGLTGRRPLLVTANGDGVTTLRLRGDWVRPPHLAGSPGVKVTYAAGVFSITGDMTGSAIYSVVP